MKATKLNDFDLDQLVEITNIGAGNAATALSHMLGKRVEMKVPESFIGNLEDVQRKLGSSDQIVLAVFLKVYGDLNGALQLIFPPTEALSIVKLLTNRELKDLKGLNAVDQSALGELGNILLGASVTALCRFLGLNIQHTIPDLAVDMLGAIMDTVLTELGGAAENILVFKVNLTLADGVGGGDLYYMFDPQSSEKILEITRKKVA